MNGASQSTQRCTAPIQSMGVKERNNNINSSTSKIRNTKWTWKRIYKVCKPFIEFNVADCVRRIECIGSKIMTDWLTDWSVDWMHAISILTFIMSQPNAVWCVCAFESFCVPHCQIHPPNSGVALHKTFKKWIISTLALNSSMAFKWK